MSGAFLVVTEVPKYIVNFFRSSSPARESAKRLQIRLGSLNGKHQKKPNYTTLSVVLGTIARGDRKYGSWLKIVVSWQMADGSEEGDETQNRPRMGSKK